MDFRTHGYSMVSLGASTPMELRIPDVFALSKGVCFFAETYLNSVLQRSFCDRYGMDWCGIHTKHL